jgi:hypothetical protein
MLSSALFYPVIGNCLPAIGVQPAPSGSGQPGRPVFKTLFIEIKGWTMSRTDWTGQGCAKSDQTAFDITLVE